MDEHQYVRPPPDPTVSIGTSRVWDGKCRQAPVPQPNASPHWSVLHQYPRRTYLQGKAYRYAKPTREDSLRNHTILLFTFEPRTRSLSGAEKCHKHCRVDPGLTPSPCEITIQPRRTKARTEPSKLPAETVRRLVRRVPKRITTATDQRFDASSEDISAGTHPNRCSNIKGAPPLEPILDLLLRW